MRRSGALVGVVAAALLLASCSADDRSEPPVAGATVPGGDPTLAANTPADLRHPCAGVPGRVASKVLGARVRARRVEDRNSARTMRCTYVPVRRGDGRLSAEIRSAPDLTSLTRLVGLYIGADRLQHHPVGVAGSNGAEVVLQPTEGVVALFAKQGFVTHVVQVRTPHQEAGERAARRLAELVVRANG